MTHATEYHDDFAPLLRRALHSVNPRYATALDALDPHAKLSELGIDSVELSELAAFIEDALDIRLRDQDLAKIATLADFTSAVRVTRAIGTMPETVVEMLLRLQDRHDTGPTFLDDQLRPERWTFANLVARAKSCAGYLQRLGAQPGDRVGLIIPEGRDFLPAFLGAILGGFTPVPMGLPMSERGLPAYLEQSAAILNTASARVLVVPDEYAEALGGELRRTVPSLEHVVGCTPLSQLDRAQTFQPVAVTANATCFLQFTSGSTAAPKGVEVSHANLMANVRAIIIDGLNSMPGRDLAVSWLPLHHDMGLIGFVVAPLLVGAPVVFMSPRTFIKRPQSWMRVIHQYKATVSFGPNFAFGLVAKRAGDVSGLDLSSLRALGCGAEPINHETLEAFMAAHRGTGLRAEAVMPVYGLAEATLAVCFDRLHAPYKTLAIDRRSYEDGGVVELPGAAPERGVLRLVSCGRALPGHALRIVDDQGQSLPSDHVGEIAFAGPSLTRYWGAADDRPRWLSTGDLGFIHDGELFVSGRKKDLIVVRGKNFHPQAIEWELEKLDGVRRGNVVAFPVQAADTEGVVIVGEVTESAPQGLKSHILDRMQAVFQLVPVDVVLVLKSSLPKTTSGKLQRRKTKSQWLQGELSSCPDAQVVEVHPFLEQPFGA